MRSASLAVRRARFPRLNPFSSPSLRNLVLSASQTKILEKEKSLLEDVEGLVDHLQSSNLDVSDSSYKKLIQRTRWHLEELFLVVIVGEFNSGKSQFVNSLLNLRDTPVCEVGVTPTTADIQILTRANNSSTSVGTLNIYRPNELKHIQNIQLPDNDDLPSWLDSANVVDTPGTNAIVEGHQELTEEFVPRADLILFVTSADRPFSESEKKFLQTIENWGKKVVVLINKMDVLESEKEKDKVFDFVQTSSRQVLKNSSHQIFPISAKYGIGMELVQEYVRKTLEDEGQLALKLENPLGVVERLLKEIEENIISTRKQFLGEDIKVLNFIQSQSEEFRKEVLRDFKFQESQIDNILLRFLQRADEFITEEFVLGNSMNLALYPGRIQKKFEEDVINDYSNEVDDLISSIASWVNEKLSSHSHRIVHEVVRRAEFHKSQEQALDWRFSAELSLLDSSGRQKLFNSFRGTSRKLLEDFERKKASSEVSKSFQNAVLQTAFVQASAVGVGGALLAASSLDFTGVTGASLLAISGLVIVPHRRHTVKRRLSIRVNRLRQDLKNSLAVHFQREIESAIFSIQNAVSAYTNYIENENEKLKKSEKIMEKAHFDVSELRHLVNTPPPKEIKEKKTQLLE